MNFTIKIILQTIFSIIAFSNCGSTTEKTHKFTFDPYSKGEKLIFISDDFKIDTVNIASISEQKNFRGLIVTHSQGKRDDPRIPYFGEMLKLLNYDNGEFIYFSFIGDTKRESTSTEFKISDLDTIKPISTKINGRLYKDIIKITSSTNYDVSRDIVSTVLWSKKEGYVSIEINGKKHWTLLNRLPTNGLSTGRRDDNAISNKSLISSGHVAILQG
jgi:hypothetical protein